MATFYGSDTSCIDDLGLIDTHITDPRVLIGQRLLRTLTTPRGALANISDDPDRGWDVRQYINSKLTTSDITTAQSEIEAECLKDEQVLSASTAVSLVGNNMTIKLDIISSAGPFVLTLNVSQLTTDLVFSFLVNY